MTNLLENKFENINEQTMFLAKEIDKDREYVDKAFEIYDENVEIYNKQFETLYNLHR